MTSLILLYNTREEKYIEVYSTDTCIDHFSFNSNKLSFLGTLESRIRNSIFQLILRPAASEGQRDEALNFAAKRREATSGIVYIIMRQLREQAIYVYIHRK